MLDASLPNIAPQVASYLREFHGEAVAPLDDELLLHRTLVGLRRARRWGFETRFSFNLFAALMFEISPDFDTHPKVRAIFADESLALDDRLGVIDQVLTEEDLHAMAGRAASASWEG